MLYNILFKFRYMYSLILTLRIDKKSFRDLIIQIDSMFNSGVFFKFLYQKHLITTTQRHDIINEKEFKDFLEEKRIREDIVQEMAEIMFNDQRINLIMHKSWLESKLKCLCAGNVEENQVLDIIESVKVDTEETYKTKLPSLFNMFIMCLRSISMNKHEMGLAASSN